MLSKYIWDNIAQENYLHNVGPECRYTFAGKQLFQMSGGFLFIQVHYHQTTLTLFVQRSLKSSCTACGTTMNKSKHWLEQYSQIAKDCCPTLPIRGFKEVKLCSKCEHIEKIKTIYPIWKLQSQKNHYFITSPSFFKKFQKMYLWKPLYFY